jgi:glycosyltransferase involved in cell wall biosynthesis
LKVVLVDPLIGGHHVGHAAHITRYLTLQGDAVTFVTWRPDEALEPLRLAGADIVYVRPNADGPMPTASNFRRIVATRAVSIKALEISQERDADVVQHLYIDRQELGISLSRSSLFGDSTGRYYGTLYWPYFTQLEPGSRSVQRRLWHSLTANRLHRMLSSGSMSGLFVHTAGIKDVLVSRWGRKELEQRIHVIPDLVVFNESVASIEESRQRLNLPQNKKIALFFGRMSQDKGAEILLRSLPYLADDVVVVVAGTVDPQLAASLRAFPPDRILVRSDWIPEEDVRYYFMAADVVLLPYLRRYSGPSGVLQNSAESGTPVVASNVGQIGRIVTSHGLGLAVEPEEPKKFAQGVNDTVHGEDDMIAKIAVNGRDYARTQDWQIAGELIRNVYLSEGE